MSKPLMHLRTQFYADTCTFRQCGRVYTFVETYRVCSSRFCQDGTEMGANRGNRYVLQKYGYSPCVLVP